MAAGPRLTARVDASPEGLREAASTLDRFEAEHGVDPESAWPVHVALDEVLSNVVRHGSAGPRAVLIEVTFTVIEHHLEVVVEDDGPAVNPLTLPAPDTAAPLEARQPGGLGVHLVRNLMDRVSYTRDGDRNRLVFARRLQPARRPGAPKE